METNRSILGFPLALASRVIPCSVLVTRCFRDEARVPAAVAVYDDRLIPLTAAYIYFTAIPKPKSSPTVGGLQPSATFEIFTELYSFPWTVRVDAEVISVSTSIRDASFD